MAKYGSDDVGFFLAGGYDVLGTSTDLTESKEAITEESHTLGDAWVEHSPVGLKRFTLSQQGFYDDDAGASNDALIAGEGLSRVVLLAPDGNAVGKKFIGFQGALQVTYERVLARGALHKANASYNGNGAVEEGVVLHTHTAETTTTGRSTAHDNGASSANGGAAYLAVSALTLGGYTNLTVDIAHSADNITFADKASFTPVTAAPTAERIALSGTINRYTAAEWTFTGTGAGPSATFAVGIHRA